MQIVKRAYRGGGKGGNFEKKYRKCSQKEWMSDALSHLSHLQLSLYRTVHRRLSEVKIKIWTNRKRHL